MNRSRKINIATAVLCLVSTLKAWKNKRTQQRKPKKWWIRPGLRNRSTSGFYATLRSKLISQDPKWLKNFLRMSMEDFDFLVRRATPYIYKKDTRFREAISVGERLAVTLRYLATGDSFSSLMTVFLLGKTTICHIIHETCGAIFEALKDEFLKAPNTYEEWTQVADRFQQRWNFPNCCGALDGKHIAIQAPANNIVLMAVVDADYKFLFAEVGAYDCESGGGVFARCPLSTAMAKNSLNIPPPRPLPHESDEMPFVIVADDAFPLKTYLMKPFSNRNQVMSYKIFNYRLSRARNVVENVFGICASRFRILKRPMDVTPKHAKAVVLAICALHNYLIIRKSVYMRVSDVDNDTNGITTPGNWRMELGETGMIPSFRSSSVFGRSADNAIKVRERFMEYFITPHGEVEWQYNRKILDSSV